MLKAYHGRCFKIMVLNDNFDKNKDDVSKILVKITNILENIGIIKDIIVKGKIINETNGT